MATTKPAKKTTTRRSTKKPVNAALDDPLFVPRLDQLTLPESALEGTGPDYSDMFESICGVADDSQQVELYDGTLGVTAAFVNDHQLPVAQVQWNDNLAAVFTNPGNVSGVRWGSGTMIGPDLFLTCGHLFDTDINGWTVPRQNGTANAISPQQAATNMHLNFEYQVDASNVLRAEQSFPITQLIEYRLGGLDMALCRIGGSPGSRYGWSEFATTNAAVGDMLAIIGHPLGPAQADRGGPGHVPVRLGHPVQRHRHVGRQLRLGHPAEPVGTGRRRAHQRRVQQRGHRQQLRGRHRRDRRGVTDAAGDDTELADGTGRRCDRHPPVRRRGTGRCTPLTPASATRSRRSWPRISATRCSRATSSGPDWRST